MKNIKQKNERIYTYTSYITERYNYISRKNAFTAKNQKEFYLWRNKLRKRLAKLSGIDTMQRCQLNAVCDDVELLVGYERQHWLIQTEPGIIMTMYVLVPSDMCENEKRTTIIAPHGHESGGKLAVAGCREFSEQLSEKIDFYNYDYGVQFVREGYVVYCPDARGFGERREPECHREERELHGSCDKLSKRAIPLGQTVVGMWTWDLMRLVDYITTLNHYNGSIVCAGLSGGGLQTLWLAAMDDRVDCAVISGYFYGALQSLIHLENCACNYIPHLFEHVDISDIGAMIAPRPMVIETGTQDYLNGSGGMSNVFPQVETAQKAYSLFDKESELLHDVFEGSHRWNGIKAIPFVKKRFPAKK